MFRDITLLLVTVFFLLLLVTVFMHMFFLVPYVPSKKRVVERMIRAAGLKPDETVYDLGCGDGRLLIESEKKVRVKTVGFEIAPLMYLLAKARMILAGSRAQIFFRNLFTVDLKPANVIFCYLLPNVMPRLSEKINKECRRGTRIISNTFHIPGLKLKKILKKDDNMGLPTVYVYQI